EESSAAATAMNEQAQRLAQVVAVFNVGHMAASEAPALQARPRTVASTRATPVRSGIQPRVASSTTSSSKPATDKAASEKAAPKLLRPAPASPSGTNSASARDDDWETF